MKYQKHMFCMVSVFFIFFIIVHGLGACRGTPGTIRRHPEYFSADLILQGIRNPIVQHVWNFYVGMGLKLLLVVPGLPRTVFHFPCHYFPDHLLQTSNIKQNPASCSGTFTRRHSPATISVVEIYRKHHRPFLTMFSSALPFSKNNGSTTSFSFKGANLNHLIPQPHTVLF